MRKLIAFCAIVLLFTACSSLKHKKSDGWISLFDGKTFNGWKKNQNPGTFTIENGTIKVAGPISHLFYDGPLMNHNFKNFEFKAQVMTKPGANSGIYFHTAFQQEGFPDKGYEVQVNNSHSDWRRTGSLYGIQDVKETYVKDNEWYEEYIMVKGKNIIIKINGKTVVDYTEPENVGKENAGGRAISNGTFALQGHDPKSIIFYKDIMVKPLAD
ncbi:MAG: 3-keto-disaccharide hydrolase [Sphingobacteriaceae bacterium]